MKRRVRNVLRVVVVVGIAVGAWAVWTKVKNRAPGPDSNAAPATKPEIEVIHDTRPSPATGRTDTRPSEILSTTRPDSALTRPQAQAAYKHGKDAYNAKKLIEARADLSRALASGHLSAGEEADAVKLLSDVAEKIIFSRTIVDGDPYAFQYVVRPGEVLGGANGIERRLRLHVPAELILRVNGMRRAEDIQAGQALKLIRGPFHAIITKGKFTMDVYLGDVFVRRYGVGIGGKDTPTPEGLFHLTLGGKMVGNTPYTPPLSSGLPMKKIMPGEPGYPLDAGGHWISLTGVREAGNGTPQDAGYGIHGTNDPSSIGKAQSHGCVRLSDKNIEDVFAMLYEKWSTVEIRP